MKIVQFDAASFKENSSEIQKMYGDVFTTGVYEQYLDIETEFDEDLRALSTNHAMGFYAKMDDTIVGFLLLAPATTDARIPFKLKKKIPLEKTLEIRKLAIDQKHRKLGIASRLVDSSLTYARAKKFEYLLVRTPSANLPATQLYMKHGFEKSVKVTATKIKKDKTGTFLEEKQFLLRTEKNI